MRYNWKHCGQIPSLGTPLAIHEGEKGIETNMKKLIRENMSIDLITIGWNERMETAHARMVDNRVRHLPVLTESGEVIGMLSDRDVQRAMVSTIERGSANQIMSEEIEFDPESRVRDYMNWPIESVDFNTDIRLVAEKMIHEKISSLLVCQAEKIVGIATVEDLLKVLIDLLGEPGPAPRRTLSNLLDSGRGRDSTLL